MKTIMKKRAKRATQKGKAIGSGVSSPPDSPFLTSLPGQRWTLLVFEIMFYS